MSRYHRRQIVRIVNNIQYEYRYVCNQLHLFYVLICRHLTILHDRRGQRMPVLGSDTVLALAQHYDFLHRSPEGRAIMKQTSTTVSL